ncbi:MAG: hypothetical protein RR521_11865, partial [Clostridia bacterium]
MQQQGHTVITSGRGMMLKTASANTPIIRETRRRINLVSATTLFGGVRLGGCGWGDAFASIATQECSIKWEGGSFPAPPFIYRVAKKDAKRFGMDCTRIAAIIF